MQGEQLLSSLSEAEAACWPSISAGLEVVSTNVEFDCGSTSECLNSVMGIILVFAQLMITGPTWFEVMIAKCGGVKNRS